MAPLADLAAPQDGLVAWGRTRDFVSRVCGSVTWALAWAAWLRKREPFGCDAAVLY